MALADVKGLRAVTVKKPELLDRIRKNRELHVKEHTEAIEGYHKKVIEGLRKALSDAQEGKAYQTFINEHEPLSHAKDYDRVILMLEMSVETHIELTEQEFSRYALDEWEWTQQFKAATANYSHSVR